MLTATKAIVLHTTKFGDKRLIVSMFTLQFGAMSFSCNISRRKHGSATNCFQPLAVLEIEFDHRPNAKIQTLRNVRLARPTLSTTFDARKLAIALFLADCLRFALSLEPTNPPLFEFLCRSLRWLDTAPRGYANFHIVFLVMLTAHLGFFPNVKREAENEWFSINEGCFTLSPSAPDAVVPPEKAALIPVLARLSFRTMHLLRLSRSQRNECTAAILDYYRLHLPAFPQLRSYGVLKELFA